MLSLADWIKGGIVGIVGWIVIQRMVGVGLRGRESGKLLMAVVVFEKLLLKVDVVVGHALSWSWLFLLWYFDLYVALY